MFGTEVADGITACHLPQPAAAAAAWIGGFKVGPRVATAAAATSDETDPSTIQAAAQLWADGGPAFDTLDACLEAARHL